MKGEVVPWFGPPKYVSSVPKTPSYPSGLFHTSLTPFSHETKPFTSKSKPKRILLPCTRRLNHKILMPVLYQSNLYFMMQAAAVLLNSADRTVQRAQDRNRRNLVSVAARRGALGSPDRLLAVAMATMTGTPLRPLCVGLMVW
jgi:hypothetical protein